MIILRTHLAIIHVGESNHLTLHKVRPLEQRTPKIQVHPQLLPQRSGPLLFGNAFTLRPYHVPTT